MTDYGIAIPNMAPAGMGKSFSKKARGFLVEAFKNRLDRDRQTAKALPDAVIGKGFLIWFLSSASRKGTRFTCNPPEIQNDAVYGERYQIVIEREA